MQKERATQRELEDRLACLYVSLYQSCGTMPIGSLENLCRKIHVIELRIYSFKGGR